MDVIDEDSGDLNVEIDCNDSDRDSSAFSEDLECPEEENEHDDDAAKRVDNSGCLKTFVDLTAEDVMGLSFDSELQACAFYCEYARCHGFVARKYDNSKDTNGNIIMRQLVCNREGLRDKKHYKRLDRVKDHKPETRTNCPAKFRVHLDYKTQRWKVISFREDHNHDLTPTEYMHLLPAYREMTEADKSQVDSLHSYGMRSFHILGYMAAQKGGYAGVGFCKKDIYNYFAKQRRTNIEDGDAFAALTYLLSKSEIDPMLFAKFKTTDDCRLQHLFWSDGGSRVDFECFGDVMAFDTTYKKNKYNKPLVIFSGSNHHKQTSIFGCALLADETVETYEWVLKTFLECMSNTHPKAVLTDGDNAMRKAVKNVFPKATHRLCAWHLHRNGVTNIKNRDFLRDFGTAIYSNFKENEFEDFWKGILDKYNLNGNRWIEKTYNKRRMWATAYFRGIFFGGMRTTSQCESINAFIRRYVSKKHSLVDFLHDFDRVVKEYRNNELVADFKSMYTEPVMTTSLHVLEDEASKIYTREIFKLVRKEIEDAGSLSVIQRTEHCDSLLFKINRFGCLNSEYWLTYDNAEAKFLCDCQLYESRGIPCSHIFCVMRQEHMLSIPSNLICQRWTKGVKSDFIASNPSGDSDSERMCRIRFGALSALCNRMCDIASKNVNDFVQMRDEILKLTRKLEHGGDPNSKYATSSKIVGDPTMVKTKGAPAAKRKLNSKKRKCRNCNKPGHTKRTCPKLIGKEIDSNDDSSFSETGTNADGFISTKKRRQEKRLPEKVSHSSQNASSDSDVDCSSNEVCPPDVQTMDLLNHHSDNITGIETTMPTQSVTSPHPVSDAFVPFSQGSIPFSQHSGVQFYSPIPPPSMTSPNEWSHSQYFGGIQNVQGGSMWQLLQQQHLSGSRDKT